MAVECLREHGLRKVEKRSPSQTTESNYPGGQTGLNRMHNIHLVIACEIHALLHMTAPCPRFILVGYLSTAVFMSLFSFYLVFNSDFEWLRVIAFFVVSKHALVPLVNVFHCSRCRF